MAAEIAHGQTIKAGSFVGTLVAMFDVDGDDLGASVPVADAYMVQAVVLELPEGDFATVYTGGASWDKLVLSTN